MKSLENKTSPRIWFNFLIQGVLGLILMSGSISIASAWTCVYVSSYHKGYAWSDAVERGLRSVLDGKCDLIQIDMDTKRNKSELYKIRKSREVAKEIMKINPDVLITSDDNAARYLVVPYFKGGNLPVIFSGINWTVEEYGFPADNITGMVEVAPIRPMLKWAQRLTGRGSTGFYLGSDTLTEAKDLKHLIKVADDLNISISSALVNDREAWQSAFMEAEDADFIILGSTAGINDWDEKVILSFVKENAKKLILTNHDWMLPFSMLGFVKLPQEQGEWAAKTAIAIHEGTPIQRIPIVANRKWEIYENTLLMKLAGVKNSAILRARSKKYIQGL
ncbi:MAG: hypothetical protein WBM38_13095 [Arenicellales bacterium]|jgi:hypothetical protein